MARKVRGFERVLDAPALFAVAYGEIGASIYFALGIIAAEALGFTPVVLLVSGAIFLLVSLSYAEGTAALPETGGAATFTRRAFNDLAGFTTGWALFLDYLIVIALSALFIPHYVGGALSIDALRDSPWDALVAVLVIAGIATVRLVRHSRLFAVGLVIALLDLGVQLLLVLLGMTLLFSPQTLADGLDLAAGQGWGDLAFALPLAFLAYTGLETVANLAEETRAPGRDLPRSLFGAIVLVVVLTVLIAVVGVSAFADEGGSRELGTAWLEAPLVGIATAFEGELPSTLVDVLRLLVGLSGAMILLTAAITAVSGCTRLAHSMASHGMLPRELARFERRSLVSSEAIIAIALVAIAIVLVTAVAADGDWAGLASVYSFGILLAFTAAQLAVIRLRMREPDLARPFRAGPDVTIRGARVPLPALVGAVLTLGVWVLALLTHPGARYVGPAWLVVGLVVYLLVRIRADRGLLEDVDPSSLPPGAAITRILVPMKLGDVGEEMAATAVALAKARDAFVEALFVVRVPRRFPLEGPLPTDVERRALASLEEARLLGEDHGVAVTTEIVRARDIGSAVIAEAERRGIDLIVLGSAPRWRRQSRFFSPTVDYILRRAPCEVLVVAFPEGVFEEVGTAGDTVR
jgi:APA family basic amino acid/polyamine antiporter